MAERDIDSLEAVPDTAAPPAAMAPRPVVIELFDVNYPEPTPLSAIVRDVARWSGHCFVMEPSLNTKLQIFAPHKLPRREAYELFLASLSVVHLRAVQVGHIVKLVPVTLVVSA